jgi:hypothetical protein
MIKLDVFVQVNQEEEVCVGQALEKDEATRLALRAKSRKNKKKTCFLYGLTFQDGVQVFFKPYSLTWEELKYVSRTYTRGTVYVTYASR